MKTAPIHFSPALPRALLLLGILCSGCATQGFDRHYIFGFGWVDTANTAAIEANSITVAGVVAARTGMSAGVVQSKTTSIDPSIVRDAVIKVEADPFHLKVTSSSPTN